MTSPLLRTRRLTGRPVTRADWPVFDAILADPEGARWLTPGLQLDASEREARARASAERLAESWATDGFGPLIWSLGTRAVGYVGLRPSRLDPRPAHEILWGLLPAYRGKGYTREAAEAALAYEPDGLVLSWTLPGNAASIGVMEALGFAYEGQADWRGFEHVVYRLERSS